MSQINAVSFRKREKNPSHTETESQILCAFNYYRHFFTLVKKVAFNVWFNEEITTSDLCDKIKNKIKKRDFETILKTSCYLWCHTKLARIGWNTNSRKKKAVTYSAFSSWMNKRLHFSNLHPSMNILKVNPIIPKVNGA